MELPMTTVYHKTNKDYRVIQRGKLWYVQQDSHNKPSKVEDHWHDIGKPQDTVEAATTLMYQRMPMPRVA